MNALAEAARMYAQRRFEGRRPEADLRRMLRSDILAMLTPEQELALRRK